MLEDLPEVVKIIHEKLEDQLCKIHFQHTLDKNGNIKATLNISLFCYSTLNINLFCYSRHEISEPALGLMASHAERVNVTIILSKYIKVFSKTLCLPCKIKIQKSYRNLDQPLQHNHLHPH